MKYLINEKEVKEEEIAKLIGWEKTYYNERIAEGLCHIGCYEYHYWFGDIRLTFIPE